jgi:hypothetical protein
VDDDWVVKVADFGLSRFNTVSNHSSLGRISNAMQCNAMCGVEGQFSNLFIYIYFIYTGGGGGAFCFDIL